LSEFKIECVFWFETFGKDNGPEIERLGKICVLREEYTPVAMVCLKYISVKTIKTLKTSLFG
jgi:hypothetical protein